MLTVHQITYSGKGADMLRLYVQSLNRSSHLEYIGNAKVVYRLRLKAKQIAKGHVHKSVIGFN